MDRLSLADLHVSRSKSRSSSSSSSSGSNKKHSNPLAKTVRHGDLPNPLAKTVRHKDLKKSKNGGKRKRH